MQTLFKNIRIVDDTQDFVGSVLVENGIILEVGEKIHGTVNALQAYGTGYPSVVERDFRGSNLVLLPAFTDLHAHFRDPGFTYKEDLSSGCAAALAGGYSAVNLMPNTNPVCSSLEQAKDVEARAEAISPIIVNQTLSMTKDLESEDFEHLKSIKKNEVLFVTDDGKGVQNDEIMKQIFEICKEKNITVMSHAEDSKFSATDMRKAENSMTIRDIKWFEKIGGHLHFCHVSTKEAIAMISESRKEGHNVTCEVTPHHIFATKDEVNNYRVNPPFREKEDIDALICAMQNGDVLAIATDHAPHTYEDKLKGAPGMIGLELAFALCYTKLVKCGFLNLSQLVKLMSTNPSQLMQLNKGQIKVGLAAHFTIAELETPFKFIDVGFVSKSQNTPFEEVELFGKIVETYI